jgi:hypothetical protein
MFQIPKPARRVLAAVLCLLAVPAAAEITRPFKLATTAVRFTPLTYLPFSNGDTAFPIASVAPHVDAITLWPEYLGIPFDEFATGPDVPEDHPWTVEMRALAAEATAAGRPLVLELGFVRRSMVGWARNDGGLLALDEAFTPPCPDFTSAEGQFLGDAFVNYVDWMVRAFEPTYVANFIEANLYWNGCGGESPSWEALLDIQHRAYDAIRAVDPDVIQFPSVHIESLYGYEPNGWDEAHYAAIARLRRDRLGMSSYPFGMRLPDGRFATPYDLPADYLVRIKLRHPEEELVIAETGWNSADIYLGDTEECFGPFPPSSESYAADYLAFVFASARYGGFDLVNWWSLRDLYPKEFMSSCVVRTSNPYPACAGEPWCMTINYMKDVTFESNTELFTELVFKAFGTMGIQNRDGTPRAGTGTRWAETLSQPHVPLR